MADVIDALKRLERVGSEDSKTTQKLIDASKALERKICEQYNWLDEEASVVICISQDKWEDGKRIPDPVQGTYSIEHRETTGGVLPIPIFWKWLLRNGVRVSDNREAATAFAADIANGLIQRIAEDLEKRLGDSTKALESFASASDKPGASLPELKPVDMPSRPLRKE